MDKNAVKSPQKKQLIAEEPNPSGVGGKIHMTESVVATIAGLAAREIPGIYKLGKSTLLPFTGSAPTRGVEAEVGEKEAALDLEVVLEYGYDIRQMAQKLRNRVADEILRMAGRKVVEVNIDVVDVHLPEADKKSEEEHRPRVV